MTNAEIILNYAASHRGNVVSRDFVAYFESSYLDGSVRSKDTELRQMMAAGAMARTGYDNFACVLMSNFHIFRLSPWK